MMSSALFLRFGGRHFVMHALVALMLCVGVCMHANRAFALEPMNDTEMGSISGQEGILVSLQY